MGDQMPIALHICELSTGAPRAEPVVPPLHTLPTPLGAEALRCASAKASEGYPPTAKSAEAAMLWGAQYLATFCAFIHGHSPRSSAQADKNGKTKINPTFSWR